MKTNRKYFWLFIGLAIIQLLVPLYMIWRWEDILQHGRQYTWVTAPIDPYDALRGRYVDLRFKEVKGTIQGDVQLSYGQTAYAMIGENEKGYAVIRDISTIEPKDDSYIKVKISYVQDGNIAHFMLPFKRYYMPEDLAPAAEEAYRKNAGKECTVLVRVKDGYGVVEQLYIGDKDIYEYLQEK